MILSDLDDADIPGVVLATHSHDRSIAQRDRAPTVAFDLNLPSEEPPSCDPAEMRGASHRKGSRVRSVNATELQMDLLNLIAAFSNELVKRVNSWPSSKSSRSGDYNVESSLVSAESISSQHSEILNGLETGDCDSKEDGDSIPTRFVTNPNLGNTLSSYTTLRSIGLKGLETGGCDSNEDSDAIPARFVTNPNLGNTLRSCTTLRSLGSESRKKAMNITFADENLKALLQQEKKKDMDHGVLKIAATDEAPIAQHKQTELAAQQTGMQAFLRSRTYELVSAIMILLNAVVISWETEVVAQRAESDGVLTRKPDLFFLLMSYVFCCIFVFDLLARAYAERWLLLTSTERSWNAFDAFVVSTMVLEVISLSLQMSNDRLNSTISKLSMLRIVRLLRIIRVARVVKIVRFFRELRVLVFSILEAMRSLMWSVLLMFILFVIFGVFLHSGVIDYLDETQSFKSESNKSLVGFFGTLINTVNTLYQSISGGIDWGEPYGELQALGIEYRWCFLMFITFSVFALLNVVTAVFVDGTIERTRKDRDFIMEVEIQSKRDIIQQLYDLFEEIDEDRDGGVTLEEFENYLRDEAILTYFNALGLDIDTAWSLFLLLDTDETGIVNIEEFVLGCVRLKGTSKKLDVALMKLEIENICSSVKLLRNSMNDLKGMMAYMLGTHVE